MKRNALLSLALAVLLLFSCVTGCASSGSPAKPSPPKVDPPASVVPLSAVTGAKDLGFTELDNQLVEYLKQAGRENENFTVSPLSFKATLTLAALGAEGETQRQLLKAMGFQSTDELRAWYATVLNGVDCFDKSFEAMKQWSDPDDPALGTAAYRVVNSVWSNRNLPGEFRQDFLGDIAETCRADAVSVAAEDLARHVNAWVNEQTNGLIPSIMDESAIAPSAILVNALYLKSGWESSFREIGDRDFTTCSGETIQKPFMQQLEHLDYYRDENTQLVSAPLQGGVSMVFVLGDDRGLADKLSKAERKLVELTLPMFEVETSLNQKELVNYLNFIGCNRIFSPEDAEFSPMYTEDFYVGNITQTAKVHIDEDGLEAAAVTSVSMINRCIADLEPELPEIFCADQPFSFHVIKNDGIPELLFWGQIVR